jgi:hypothetical protein
MMRKMLLLSFAIPLVLPHGSRQFALPAELPASPQDAVALVSRTQAIPKGFKTYSLFLICNPLWLDPARNSGLLQLYRQFLNFGRAIGDDQAALWFWSAAMASMAPPDSLWVRLLTATQQTIDGFGCAWSFKINAGPVSADLKSCKTN